ncbi:DUF4313 domain-containing protein [Clostridium sp. AF19-22AC]|jgi:hypothetical protein|uniref:DUF4313 domain-containing protein n=1 Tax=Clostridia TaxID=186801 RepID=UPI000E4713C3|nr:MULTISPECIES: DUF4313 domain-containing protein [Clostridia]RHR25799.1 DUF4313 domain-containing protein [Clostridium sp. AF19-22AC]
MEEEKTLGYDWEFGHEELVIEVGAYAYGDRLYIGLLHKEDGEMESFADLTINLPYSPAEINEAYIDDFARNSKLNFIKKHKLGKVLPEEGYSGYARYSKVAFNLDRLAELDPKGVEKYRALHGMTKQEPEKRSRTKKSKKGQER